MEIYFGQEDIPARCEYCPLCRYYRENGNIWCNGKNRLLAMYQKNCEGIKKPEWCPIKVVPERIIKMILDANETGREEKK